MPAALISASALLCLALYNRLASVISRIRGFQRERLQELEAYADHMRTGQEDASSVQHHQQLLHMLEVQTHRVYRRARMIRLSLLCLLSAIACLTLCSLTTGLAMVLPRFGLAAGVTAQVLFVAGMGLLMSGAMCAFLEVWKCLEPVHLESQFVTQLGRQLDSELLKDESLLPVNGHGGETSES